MIVLAVLFGAVLLGTVTVAALSVRAGRAVRELSTETARVSGEGRAIGAESRAAGTRPDGART
ncbi:hypothetical protein [Nocardiopsis xinjiangensis]|uniref:hypothetical protein n=1 Tax=Nocardiopsis xinjiangensis TaxID=124285 RepID=UPI00034C529E|nr:hypothetical protein [Nocardiopsis xinjiangensis]